jgi:ABC-type multidrug transport system ATPase subunit
MLLNGVQAVSHLVHSIISYVPQDDDALLPSLTVRETLRFAAGLRLPSSMSKKEKHRRAEDVLFKMGLKDCANYLIGSDHVKGISGGEKRRVTIAIQLLTDPKILLLDEPTSGLDAFTAQSIMDLLRNLAQEGRTIILAIHQSRSNLWPTFRNVLLLTRGGYTIYAGPGSDMLNYFASLGFKCPEKANPADFALDLVTIDLRRAKRESVTREKVQQLIDSWNNVKKSRPNSVVIPIDLDLLQKSMVSTRRAFPILARRSTINFWRERNAAIGRIMQVVGYGIVLTLFFTPLRTDYNSIQTRLGYITSVPVLYFVGMLQNVAGMFIPFWYHAESSQAYNVPQFIRAKETYSIGNMTTLPIV